MDWLLLSIFLICLTTMSSQNCPMTSIMDLNNSRSFLYPLDVYAPYALFEDNLRRNQTFHCFAAFKNELQYPHQCSTNRFCPITQENIADATKRKFHRSSSICHLKPKLHNKNEKVNLFVFGGSVTIGIGSQGCTQDDPKDFQYSDFLRCSWVYHFGEWLKNKHAANLSYYNLAIGGHTSYVRSRTFPNELKEYHNISSFSSNDIILIDHSVNDHAAHTHIYEYEKDLESLILRIYSLSLKNSWPTIIVLDADPAEFHGPKVKLYPIAYEKIVRHYNISMWSYSDAASSNYSRTIQRNFSEFIRWNNNDEGDIHPTWHIHLFMADLYSAIFSTEMSKCTNHIIALTTKAHASPLVLPAPLSIAQLENECNADNPLFLSFSQKSIKRNSIVGSYETHPENIWKLREDKKGRGGFIAEFEEGIYPTPFIENATISFILNETTKALASRYRELHIKMLYLGTYENAGVARVFYCGVEKKPFLTALWRDHLTNRISIPELFEHSFLISNCLDANYTYPIVQFVHFNFTEEPEVRKNQKFKIIDIKVCALI